MLEESWVVLESVTDKDEGDETGGPLERGVLLMITWFVYLPWLNKRGAAGLHETPAYPDVSSTAPNVWNGVGVSIFEQYCRCGGQNHD